MSARGLGQPEDTERGQGHWKVCLQVHGYSLINLLQAHLTQNDITHSRGPFLTSSSSRSSKAGIFNSILPMRKEVIYTVHSLSLMGFKLNFLTRSILLFH